jgi:NAD+ kinase
VKRDSSNYTVAGFILKPDSPEIKELFNSIKKQFEAFGLTVLLSKKSAKMIGEDGVDFDTLCKQSDFLVSLGGDGTLLSLVRRSYKYNKPVAGINAGNLGFLADVRVEEVEIFLRQLKNGECRIDERMMICAILESATESSKSGEFFAFNDVVVTRDAVSKMATVEAYVEDEIFNVYRGDGLIISTPTGSTAYNLAANGPVVYPLTQAFVVNPICPHSLTQRPLVMPADFTIKIKTPQERLQIVVDGQDNYALHNGDRLLIRGAKRAAKLLHRKERNYFGVLRDKLLWGES